MSTPTPLRVIVTTDEDGWRTVVVACSCAKVGRALAQWEPVAEAVAEMIAEHRRMAPTCPHPTLPALGHSHGLRGAAHHDGCLRPSGLTWMDNG